MQKKNFFSSTYCSRKTGRYTRLLSSKLNQRNDKVTLKEDFLAKNLFLFSLIGSATAVEQ